MRTLILARAIACGGNRLLVVRDPAKRRTAFPRALRAWLETVR